MWVRGTCGYWQGAGSLLRGDVAETQHCAGCRRDGKSGGQFPWQAGAAIRQWQRPGKGREFMGLCPWKLVGSRMGNSTL